MKHAQRESIRSERGQGMVEMAIVLMFVMLCLLGVIDLGRATYMGVALSSAAQKGARVGSTTNNVATIANATKNDMIMVNKNKVTVTVTRNSSYTQVDVSFDYRPVTPMISRLLTGGKITLIRSARVTVLGSQ